MSRKAAMLKAKQSIIDALTKLHISRVEVEYDGSGDSGDIQNVTAFDDDQEVEVDIDEMSGVEPQGEYDPKTGKTKPPKKKANPNPVKVKVVAAETNFEKDAKGNYGYVTKNTEKEITLKEACENFAQDFLAYQDIDWYNNEGGFGKVIINAKEGEVKLEHNMRVESSEYSEHTL